MVQVMEKPPLSIIKERFGEDAAKAKAQLVEAVKKAAGKDLWIDDRLNESKGLEHVSNRKLLHLERVFRAVTDEVGSRDKLIAQIAELEGKARDEAYRTRLSALTTPALWDRFQAARARASRKATKGSK